MTLTRHPDIVPIGIDALLVRFADRLDRAANRAVIAFRDALEHDMPVGVVEVTTSLTSVMVVFDRSKVARDGLRHVLTERVKARDWYLDGGGSSTRIWHVPCAFGGDNGPQLNEVADIIGMSTRDTVADLVAHPVNVLAIGFAPGQPYLGLLPERWDIPRQTALTAQVPAGALIVAIRQLVHFTAPSPTGWRQIGRTAFRNFNPGGAEPFPLRPGDEVRFVPVSADEFDRIEHGNENGLGGARLEVLT